jgi:hypothetical protein
MNDTTMENNPVEDELNAIRIKLYEQTKDMTSSEQTAFFSDMVKEGFARHGITPRYAAAPPARPKVQS